MFQPIFNLIKEFQAFKKFFDKTHKMHRRLVFYSEREIYYQTLGPFINKLLKDENISYSYITSDANDPILTQHSERLYPFYFNSLLKSVFDKMDARYFVFTMPDLNVYHLKKSKLTKEYIYFTHFLARIYRIMSKLLMLTIPYSVSVCIIFKKYKKENNCIIYHKKICS